MLFCLGLSGRTTQISNILCASASLREKSTDEFRFNAEARRPQRCVKKHAGTVPDESCSGVSSFEVSSCQNSVEDGWNMRSIAQPDPLSFVFCPLSSKPQNQKPETRN